MKSRVLVGLLSLGVFMGICAAQPIVVGRFDTDNQVWAELSPGGRFNAGASVTINVGEVIPFSNTRIDYRVRQDTTGAPTLSIGPISVVGQFVNLTGLENFSFRVMVAPSSQAAFPKDRELHIPSAAVNLGGFTVSSTPDNTDAVLRSITTLVASVSGNITGPVATEHLFTINAGGSVLAAADLTATNADFSLAQFSAVEFVRAAGSIAGDVEATAGSIERVRLVNPGNISGQSIDGNIIAAEHIGSIFSSGGIGVNGLRL